MSNSNATIDAFFNPSSVAVVGASSRADSVGCAVMRNLLFGSFGDFEGRVVPVNRKGGTLYGLEVSTSLAEAEGPIDLVVVCIPAPYVPGVIDEAAQVGAKAVVVISAGFGELGEEGLALQADMVGRARGHGIRVIGPNCLGIMRPSHRLNASFAAGGPPAGRIGVLSQSGALVTGLLSYAERECFGLSAAVSLGAKADVGDTEMLDFFARDPETHAVGLYVEAFPDPPAALAALTRLAAIKPVVALKGGATEAGAKAASSHTGALAGSAAAYRAAFAQAGVEQVDTIGDFMSAMRALADQPPAAGNRVAILTNAGGPGVLSADEAGRCGLSLAELSDETQAALDEVLPSVWSHNNPVDVIGDATPERYAKALAILGAAPEVDGIVLIMTVQAMTEPQATAEAIAAAVEGADWSTPVVCSFLGLVGTDTGSYLDARGIPELNCPEDAVRAMGALVRRGAFLRREIPTETPLERHPAPELDRARAVVKEAQAAGQRNLDLARARQVLEAAGVRYNGSGTAADADAAVAMAEQMGFPVVLKLISPDVVHKSDVGGVVLDVVGADAVREACAQIRQRVEAHQPGARITGFTVEEQVSGTEIIIGTSRDAAFGTLLMVGMGGVFVEVYKDVSFRLVPLSRSDALHMIGEIRAQPLLDGARGRPKLDRRELAELLLRISALVQAVPEIVEVDLNPLVLTEQGLVAIDARVVVN